MRPVKQMRTVLGLTTVAVIMVLVLTSAGAQATGGSRIAASCSNETVNGGKYVEDINLRGEVTLRFVLSGSVTCDEAHRLVRAYFGKMAADQQCGNLNSFCDLQFAGGWDCFMGPPAKQQDGASAGCARTGAKIRLYKATAAPPTRSLKTGVYINCQNRREVSGSLTQTLIPLQHPRTCVVYGQPESISTLYPLVRAHWKGWGKATATVNAIWDNPSPREGPPSPIRAKAYRIRRGCDGRRFYTRVSVPGFRHTTIVLHLSAACKLPPL